MKLTFQHEAHLHHQLQSGGFSFFHSTRKHYPVQDSSRDQEADVCWLHTVKHRIAKDKLKTRGFHTSWKDLEGGLSQYLNLNNREQTYRNISPTYRGTSPKFPRRYTSQVVQIPPVAALQRQRIVAISRASAQDMNGDTASA